MASNTIPCQPISNCFNVSTGPSDNHIQQLTHKPKVSAMNCYSQALAEPSDGYQASAEPSSECRQRSQPALQPHKPKLIFRPSTTIAAEISTSYSDSAIARQKDIITSIWPSTTPEARRRFPEFCHLYDSIKSCGLPNFLGAKIPLSSALNLQPWQRKLVDYHDKEVCTFLEFGWPVGYHSITPPSSAEVNHPSATLHFFCHGRAIHFGSFCALDTMLSLNDAAEKRLL